MKKEFMAGVVIMLIVGLLCLLSISSHAQSNIADTIKIGIEYEKEINSKIIESNTEIQATHNNTTIYDFYNLYNLNIKKEDDIFVQIGDAFNSKDSIMKEFYKVRKETKTAIPFYNGKWYIYAGPFEDMETAYDFMKSEKVEEYSKDIKKSAKIISANYNNEKIILFDTENDIEFTSKDKKAGLMTVNDKKYRGSIIFKRFPESDLTTINKLKMNEYLYGVLPAEMNTSWPIEALKAQAVAARNFAMSNYNKFSMYDFNLSNDTRSQVYKGYSVEGENSNKAVDETLGVIMLYNNNPISAFYHANSGGRTQNSEDVWSSKVTYLRGVKDDYSNDTYHSTWEKTLTNHEIEEVLNKEHNLGKLQNIKINSLSKNGTVTMMTFIGSNNDVVLKKQRIRSTFGYNFMSSTTFYIKTDTGNILRGPQKSMASMSTISNNFIQSNEVNSYSEKEEVYVFNGTHNEKIKREHLKIYTGLEEEGDDIKNTTTTPKKYTFIGKGWGHGLGMSQEGARIMALKGLTYKDILSHYYTGINFNN